MSGKFIGRTNTILPPSTPITSRPSHLIVSPKHRRWLISALVQANNEPPFDHFAAIYTVPDTPPPPTSMDDSPHPLTIASFQSNNGLTGGARLAVNMPIWPRCFSCKWFSILLIVTGSVIHAITLAGPLQTSQISISILNARFKHCAKDHCRTFVPSRYGVFSCFSQEFRSY